MNKLSEEYPLLVAQEGPLKGQRWQLSQTIVLGREASCDVVVADRQISRFHARVTPTPEGVILEDLGSKNGTMLNGRTIDGTAALEDGAVIVLGTTVMKFRALATAGSTETIQRKPD